MTRIFSISLIFALLLFCACQGGESSVDKNTNVNTPVTEPADPETPETEPTDETPGDDDPGDIIPIGELPVATVLSRFFYNNNVYDLNSDYTISQVCQASAYAISKDKTFYIKDSTAYINDIAICSVTFTVKNVFVIDKKYFAVDSGGELYQIVDGECVQLCNNDALIWIDSFANEAGYCNGSSFTYYDGTKMDGYGIYTNTGKGFKIETFQDNLVKLYYFDDKKAEWVYITAVSFMSLYKDTWTEYNGKLYSTRGPVIDLDGTYHKIPTFDNTTKSPTGQGYYKNGNAFLQYLNYPYRTSSGTPTEYFHYIGMIDNVGYYLRGKTGSLVKYFFETDKIVEVSLMQYGTLSSDATDNKKFFDRSCPVMIGNYIYYCDGTNVMRYDMTLATKETIAEATTFKAMVF